MSNIQCTVLHFDYGGYYSKNGVDESLRWISRKDSIYTIVMKTSMEDVSYSDLVDRIYKKIAVDQAVTKLKISYIPLLVEPKKPSYILDDEDLFGYLVEVNKDQCRSLLHVELIEDVQENQNREYLSRDNRGTDEVDEKIDYVHTPLSRENDSKLTADHSTRVFLDVEDYPIPESLDPESIYDKIKSSLEEKGYRGSLSIFLFADEKNTFPKEMIEKYEYAGIDIVFVPKVAGVKYVRVHRMLLEIFIFALHNHHKKSNLMVLSKDLKEDSESISHLNGLHSRGYNILISEPSSKLRLSTESSEWIWKSLLDGGNPN